VIRVLGGAVVSHKHSLSQLRQIFLMSFELHVRQSHCITDHRDAIYDAKYSPDGSRLATASNDDVVMIWDTTAHDSMYA
jgi:WD40 repeat protein